MSAVMDREEIGAAMDKKPWEPQPRTEMKVTAPRRDLYALVQRASRAVGTKSTLPVLKTYKLTASYSAEEGAEEYGDLQIRASDLNTTALFSLSGVKVGEPGSCCVDADQLTAILAALPEGEVTLHSYLHHKETDPQSGRVWECWNVKLLTRASTFDLPSLDPGDFPETHGGEWDSAPAVTIKGSVLSRALATALTAVADEKIRPTYAAAHFEAEPGETLLRITATDMHRMTHERAPLMSGAEGKTACIVPDGYLKELRGMIDPESPVTLRFLDNGVCAEVPGGRYFSRVLDGQFARYERVIPTAPFREFRLMREDLMSVLRRMKIVAKDAASKDRVRIILSGFSATVSADGDRGRAEEALELSHPVGGEEFDFAINVTYLLAALGSLGTEQFVLRASNPLTPMLVQEVGEGDTVNDDLKYVIMPMQVN